MLKRSHEPTIRNLSLIFQVVISPSLARVCVCLLTLMIQQLYNVTYRTFMSYE